MPLTLQTQKLQGLSAATFTVFAFMYGDSQLDKTSAVVEKGDWWYLSRVLNRLGEWEHEALGDRRTKYGWILA